VSVSHRRWLALAAAFVLAACVSQETQVDAIKDINAAFRADYEAGLANDGARTLKRPLAPCSTPNAALTRLAS
jgi:hypothetical protein